MKYTKYLVLAGAVVVMLYAWFRKLSAPTEMDDALLRERQDTFVLKSIVRYPFVGGSTRNGIRAMEGIEFEFNKQDSTKFDYRFSIVNWRDKFRDLTGTVAVDSSSLYQDTFFIKNENDSLVPAVKLYDNGKRYPVWIGLNKTGNFFLARIFEKRPNELKEISYGSLWAK